MKVADEVWLAVALLQRENPGRADFAVQEIKARARKENWAMRPGFSQHVSYHCVASKPADPVNHRMLHEDSRGRRRLYRRGDAFHPERENGKIRPDRLDLLPHYKSLIDWYDEVYSKQASAPPLAPANIKQASHQERAGSDPQRTFAAIGELQSRTVFVSSTGAVLIPNDLRKELRIEEGTRLSVYREHDHLVLQPITDEFIHSLVGCLKGMDSLVEAREREHRIEKDRTAQ
jgi:bifunctional DNA-binding transcriptional regulator/antitoxin component of YhaV-PrlF toxin-antitoxin module